LSTAALLALVLAVEGAPRPKVPVFSAATESVRLDVSVTRDGVPVRGLTVANFAVEDEGVRQTLELVDLEDAAIHTLLALDTSSSVAGPELARLKSAAHLFVDALRQGDALSLLTFAECSNLSLAGSQSRQEAHAAIEIASTRQTTSLYDALLAALALADPWQGRPLVLVFSDGQDVGSWTAADRVLEVARESEVVVHAVMPGGRPVPLFLEQLAESTGGHVWPVGGDAPLAEVFLKVLEEFRGRYRLRYEPAGVKPGGWHRLKVELKDAKGKVRARPGYRHRSAD
jgi:tight adherence protein B